MITLALSHHSSRVSWIGGVISLALVLLAAGCSVRSPAIGHYAIDYPSPQRGTGKSIAGTLMVYRFLLANSVNMDSLVLVDADGNEQLRPIQRWGENPADMVTELIVRDLEGSGLFLKTVDQSSQVPYRYALEGTLLTLQGIRKEGKVLAILEAEVTLIDYETSLDDQKHVMKKPYRVEISSVDEKPDSIVAAANVAVKTLSELVRKDIRAAIVRPKGQKPQQKSPDLPLSAVRMS